MMMKINKVRFPTILAVVILILDCNLPISQAASLDKGDYLAPTAKIFATPARQSIEPGGTAQYMLHLQPTEGIDQIALNILSPSRGLEIELSSTIITPDQPVTMTVTDKHELSIASLNSGQIYTIPILLDGVQPIGESSVTLRVGSTQQIFLPMVMNK